MEIVLNMTDKNSNLDMTSYLRWSQCTTNTSLIMTYSGSNSDVGEDREDSYDILGSVTSNLFRI